MYCVSIRLTVFVSLLFLSGCFNEVKKDITVADLASSPIDYPLASRVSPERLHAIEQYQTYLQKTEFKTHYGEALRRVADLELEVSEEERHGVEGIGGGADAAAIQAIKLSSIEHYNTYLITYPGHENNDLILYQLAKAYSLVGEMDKAMESMDKIVKNYPQSRHIDEVQFRRGEILFVNQDFKAAEKAYAAVVFNYQKSPLYEKSLYKLGWTQFKQSHYTQALQTYLSLLDIKESEGKINQYGISRKVNNSEKDFIIDSLRVTSLSLSYLDGYKTIPSVFKNKTNAIYLPLIYEQLGKLYSRKGRYEDAADTFMAFTIKYPQSVLSPSFHSLALKAYIDGGINQKVLGSKILYVKNYGVGTPYWLKQKPEDQNKIKPELVRHISELALHFHAKARKSKKQKDFKVAALWYKDFLRSFPKDVAAARMNFLYAEALYDSRAYNQALAEYEKTAYQYPTHPKSAEAGYAALLTYNVILKTLKGEPKTLLASQSLASSVRFSNTFPNSRHAPAVVTKTAENLLQAKNYPLAAEFAKRILDNKNIKKLSLQRTAAIVYAHSLYELKQYAEAEKAYIVAISRVGYKTKNDKKLKLELTDKLAASIYKQAEMYKAKGDKKMAAFYFMRVGRVAPSSSIRVTAEYDAATLYMEMKDWKASSHILESMRKMPKLGAQYAQGISSKLVFIYTQTAAFGLAAKELSVLSGLAKTPEDKRKLLWQSAEMYEKAKQQSRANGLYLKYITKYPKPFLQSIEAYSRVSNYYDKKKETKNRNKWLNKLIAAEKKGAKWRTDRSRYLAADAAFKLAQPVIVSYEYVKLNIPLKKSLRTKKKRMKQAVASLKRVMSYKVAEFSTASTFQMGEIYNHLAYALMESQRPKGLSADELEQYEVLLEEQAYPFEEKSIDIHSLNAKRTKQSIYDKWVKKSIDVLKKIQPIRYAKYEKIEPYVLITH